MVIVPLENEKISKYKSNPNVLLLRSAAWRQMVLPLMEVLESDVRKQGVVLRLLQGYPVEALLRELEVKIIGWRHAVKKAFGP